MSCLSSNVYTKKNYKLDLKNIVLDRVQTFYWCKTECPVCGYKNKPETLARLCPECGENLKVGEGHELVDE